MYSLTSKHSKQGFDKSMLLNVRRGRFEEIVKAVKSRLVNKSSADIEQVLQIQNIINGEINIIASKILQRQKLCLVEHAIKLPAATLRRVDQALMLAKLSTAIDRQLQKIDINNAPDSDHEYRMMMAECQLQLQWLYLLKHIKSQWRQYYHERIGWQTSTYTMSDAFQQLPDDYRVDPVHLEESIQLAFQSEGLSTLSLRLLAIRHLSLTRHLTDSHLNASAVWNDGDSPSPLYDNCLSILTAESLRSAQSIARLKNFLSNNDTVIPSHCYLSVILEYQYSQIVNFVRYKNYGDRLLNQSYIQDLIRWVQLRAIQKQQQNSVTLISLVDLIELQSWFVKYYSRLWQFHLIESRDYSRLSYHLGKLRQMAKISTAQRISNSQAIGFERISDSSSQIYSGFYQNDINGDLKLAADYLANLGTMTSKPLTGQSDIQQGVLELWTNYVLSISMALPHNRTPKQDQQMKSMIATELSLSFRDLISSMPVQELWQDIRDSHSKQDSAQKVGPLRKTIKSIMDVASRCDHHQLTFELWNMLLENNSRIDGLRRLMIFSGSSTAITNKGGLSFDEQFMVSTLDQAYKEWQQQNSQNLISIDGPIVSIVIDSLGFSSDRQLLLEFYRNLTLEMKQDHPVEQHGRLNIEQNHYCSLIEAFARNQMFEQAIDALIRQQQSQEKRSVVGQQSQDQDSAQDIKDNGNTSPPVSFKSASAIYSFMKRNNEVSRKYDHIMIYLESIHPKLLSQI
ncbi:hypothetical protein MIR68_003136 [Amoeboaphelidium protococcarum]|nr:hypothetical protein MIR68_003136 [Amoeboaphelidium protococcarum]